mgnify:FL=1|tara:strand:- start:340 stop:822 length:483 start_codon:yes stop_codon:yes gene_type:complete
MMEIKKDFLDKEYLKELKKPIYEGTMGFYFNDTVAGVGDKKIKDCYFTHVLYTANKPNSDLFQLYVPLLEKLKVKSLIRMKINVYPRTEKLYHHASHADFPYKHTGCVFSLNTCDGGTQIGDKFIPSIENQILIFDGSIEHNSTTCTNTQARFNVNINYF